MTPTTALIFCSMPLEADTAGAGDSGVPLVLSHPDAATAQSYRSLADGVAAEVERIAAARSSGGALCSRGRWGAA